jgi:hypothetical protein
LAFSGAFVFEADFCKSFCIGQGMFFIKYLGACRINFCNQFAGSRKELAAGTLLFAITTKQLAMVILMFAIIANKFAVTIERFVATTQRL